LDYIEFVASVLCTMVDFQTTFWSVKILVELFFWSIFSTKNIKLVL